MPARSIRRFTFVLALARIRLARRGGRFALAALGVAAGAAVLAGVLGTSLAAQDASMGRAVTALPADQRAVRAVWFGSPIQAPGGLRGLDRIADGALTPIAGRTPFRVLLFKESNVRDVYVDLAAIDDLSRFVRLRSGRLPRVCRPGFCEVLEIAGAGKIPPRFRVVGQASLTSTLPLGDLVSAYSKSSILSSAARYHEPNQPPFLLSGSIDAIAADPSFVDNERTYTWIVPLGAGDVRPWDVGGLAARAARAQSALDASGALFALDAPTDAISAAQATARTGARRLLLLGGGAAALLLMFVVLAASALRRDAEVSRRQLAWRGATRPQLAVLTLVEAGFVALAGAVAGWAAGAGLAALAARRLGAPAGGIVSHSVLAGSGIAVAAVLAAVAAVALAASLWSPVVRVGARALTLADVAAIGALVAIVVGVARGATDASSLADHRGTGVFLLLLPGLVSLVLAVAAARLLAPALRGLERLGRRGPVSLRLAALSLARNPGRATSAVVFLVVSLGLALFAATYRSTLVRGEHDEAAFAVPANAVVSEDLTKLVTVLDAAPPASWPRLGAVTPVLRLAGDVPQAALGSQITLLGVPARSLRQTGGWRPDFSSDSLASIARKLTPPTSEALRGIRLGRRLVLPVRLRGGPLSVEAAIVTPRGETIHVHVGTAAPGTSRLVRTLPAAAQGGLLIALELGVTHISHFGLANAGLGAQPEAAGSLDFPTLRAWLGSGGVSAHGAYLVSVTTPASVRSPEPTDRGPIPVVASPRLAATADNGLLSVDLGGQTLVGRVVAVAKRFPSAPGDFVLADRQTLETALDSSFPGSGTTDELWVNGPRAIPPDLAVVRRSVVEAGLRADPLARGALIALGGTAVVAIALALVGLLLALVAQVRDERPELLDLEGQGAGPRMLRRHLRLRMAILTGFGAAGGLAAGAILGVLVTDLIVLTANATAPQPPLLVAVDWRVVLAGAGAYLLVAAVAVLAAARPRRLA